MPHLNKVVMEVLVVSIWWLYLFYSINLKVTDREMNSNVKY